MTNGDLEAQASEFDLERYNREQYDKRLHFEHHLINRRRNYSPLT